MNVLLWAIVFAFLAALVSMQLRVSAAYKTLGVKEPKAIKVMRVINIAAVCFVVAYALWKWDG
ncbi:MAG: hypothetical protein KGZ89_04635 [Actinobacteria bacterium]|nr:hypothetical protein [Actinomycetota bacterium]